MRGRKNNFDASIVFLESCSLSTQSQKGSSDHQGYLVDPASSHMLVSKIKPCMCKIGIVLREYSYSFLFIVNL